MHDQQLCEQARSARSTTFLSNLAGFCPSAPCARLAASSEQPRCAWVGPRVLSDRIPKMADAALVEETVKRLSSHKGVLGIVILNADAVPIRSTLDQELAVQYAALVSQLTTKARSMVRELATEDDLQFLRLRSKKHEIMIAPSFDKEHQYSLVVVQDPSTD